eukprot:scaffold845_cov364-Prasinococcus_capsulatus_cf.AAC.25
MDDSQHCQWQQHSHMRHLQVVAGLVLTGHLVYNRILPHLSLDGAEASIVPVLRRNHARDRRIVVDVDVPAVAAHQAEDLVEYGLELREIRLGVMVADREEGTAGLVEPRRIGLDVLVGTQPPLDLCVVRMHKLLAPQA